MVLLLDETEARRSYTVGGKDDGGDVNCVAATFWCVWSSTAKMEEPMSIRISGWS